MRTEQDLHSAFQSLEEAADAYGTPDFATVATAPTTVSPLRPARRNWVAISSSVAAAAIAALVIGIVVPSTPHSRNRPAVIQPGTSTSAVQPVAPLTAPQTFDLRSLWFSLRPLDGVQVSGVMLSTTSQQVQLDSGTGQEWDVTLTAAGTDQPMAEPGAEAIQIGGRPGYYGSLSGLGYATAANQPVGLVWEYAPGAWATVVSHDQHAISAADATAIADAVEPGQTKALTVPIKVGTAPEGMQLQAYIGGPGGSRLTQIGTQGINALIDFTSGTETDVTVDFGPRISGEPLSGTRTTIGGRTAYVMNGSIRILVGSNYEMHAIVAGNAHVTPAELLTIANSIEVASNPQDQSTWFDATEALP